MTAVYAAHFQDITFEHNGKQRTIIAPNVKSVCLAMADNANDEGEGSYAGIATLSDKTELSENTVVAALKALKSAEIAYFVGISKLGTNNYTLNKALIEKMATWERRKGKAPKGRVTPNARASQERTGGTESVETGEPLAMTPIDPVEAASTGELKPLQSTVEAASTNPLNILNHQYGDDNPVTVTETDTDMQSLDNTHPEQEKPAEPRTAANGSIQERPDGMDVFLAFERKKAAVREGNPLIEKIQDFPIDVQPLLTEIVRVFHFAVIPDKPRSARSKGGQYAQWILELRAINKMMSDSRLNVGLEIITSAKLMHDKRPYAVTHPAALNNLVLEVLRQKKSLQATQTPTPKQGNTPAPVYVPAPADIQPM
jgi:hypothetical protein